MILPGRRPPSGLVPHRILLSYSDTCHPSSRLTHMRSPSDWRRGVRRLDTIAMRGSLDLDDGGVLEHKGRTRRV
jgi:hypothetical protein